MEIPENTLKEIKLSFTTKTAYEKEGVDAYIEELFMQINDAKRALDFKQKELNQCKKELKAREEARMLEGSPEDLYDDLVAERDAANHALAGVREQLTDTEDKLREANERIDELTKELERNTASEISEEYAAEVKALKAQLAEQETKLDEAEQKIVDLTEECEKYDEALAKLQAEGSVKIVQDTPDKEKVRAALQNAKNQIDMLTKAKTETEARLEDAYRELETVKAQLTRQPADAKPAPDPMIDLFTETQTFLNAAREKATALISDAQQQAARILQDAKEEAQKIRNAAQQDTAVQQKYTAGELNDIEKQLAEVRAAIVGKLEEAAAIAAGEAARLSGEQEKG